MKVRDGFVSNSSSSSFMVKREAYPNLFELAKAMIRIRGFQNDQDLLKTLDEGTIPKDHPVSFNTINGDTYIVLADGNYHVKTSHNHPWQDGDVGVEGIKSILHGVKSRFDNGDWYEISHRFNFWYPESPGAKIVGHTIRSWKEHENCGGDVVVSEETLQGVCLKCGKEVDVMLSGFREVAWCCADRNMVEARNIERAIGNDQILWCPVCGKIRVVSWLDRYKCRLKWEILPSDGKGN